MTDDEAAARRARILTAARWCFLNFGFAKTAFEDIARRAGLSRTLLCTRRMQNRPVSAA
ncbi:MAG: TetR family transcriptional regulator [Candidatus Acidiferrales bacterium]